MANTRKGKTTTSGASLGTSHKQSQSTTPQQNRHNGEYSARSQWRRQKNTHNVQMQPQLQATPRLLGVSS